MNWTNISLGKYNQIKEIFLDPDFTEEDRLIYEIKILFGVDALKLNLNELHKYINELSFLGEKIPKMKIKETYNLGGNVYVLKKNLKDFTVAQWIDWQNFLKNGADTDNFANLLSVFFFPKGESEYAEGYDIETVRHDLNDFLSIADAISISSFFLLYRKVLLIRSLLYTRKMTLKNPLTRKQRKAVKKEMRLLLKTTLAGD